MIKNISPIKLIFILIIILKNKFIKDDEKILRI